MTRKRADSRGTGPIKVQPSSQVTDEQEAASPQHDAFPQPLALEAGPTKEGSTVSSMLEMWFREAEVIARNLKESGTRR